MNYLVHHDSLKRVAEVQHGYFTAQQAQQAGYSSKNFGYHVQRNNWIRICRSLFRLPGYANTQESEFTKESLRVIGRSKNRTLVVGYESALSYYGLDLHGSENFPQPVHLIMFGAKLRTSMPEDDDNEIGHIITLRNLSSQDYVMAKGFLITTPLRTLLDMKPDLLLSRRWNDTVDCAKRFGLIDRVQASNLIEQKSEYRQQTVEERAPQMSINSVMGKMSQSAPSLGSPLDQSRRITGGHSLNRQGVLGSRSAFTLVELLVVIAIIAILAAILMPVLQKSLGAAKVASCANNYRQLGMVLNAYNSDYNGYEPSHTDITGHYGTGLGYILVWYQYFGYNYFGYTALPWSINNPFVCPSLAHYFRDDISNLPGCCYVGSNTYTTTGLSSAVSGKKLSRIKYSASKVCRLATKAGYVTGHLTNDYYNIGYPHDSRTNVLFLDSHVKMMPQLLPTCLEDNSFWNIN